MNKFNVETLRALLARVEAATGPDRQLDWDICQLIEPTRAEIISVCRAPRAGKDMLRYTASIDAAVALIERVLPDHNIRFSSHAYINGVYQGDGKSIVTIYSPLSSSGPPRWAGIGNNYALSYCSALLRALIHIAEARAND